MTIFRYSKSIKQVEFMVRILLFMFLLLSISFSSQAKQKNRITATELNQICAEVDKKSLGNKFDKILSSKCIGYISGFFDSMIILENQTKEKPFCVPNTLPKSQATLFLKSWISKNKRIAPNITGSVALFAAFKTAFPCKEEEEDNP